MYDPETTNIQYRTAIWNLLIAFGGVMKNGESDHEYLSSTANCSRNLTIATLAMIENFGFDAMASDDPANLIRYGFAGTFAESPDEVHFLGGNMILKNGKVAFWITKKDQNYGLREMFDMVLNPLSLSEATDHLRKRLKADSFSFNYSCRLGKIPARNY